MVFRMIVTLMDIEIVENPQRVGTLRTTIPRSQGLIPSTSQMLH
jgi:hypothetical protein